MAQEENIRLQQMRYRNTNLHIKLLLEYFVTKIPKRVNEWEASTAQHANINLNLHYSCCSESFEATNNSVELHLHLAPCYRLENGALQPASKELNGSSTIGFDRRKTVGDLRLAIYQVTQFPKYQILCLDLKNKQCVYMFGFVCSDAGTLGRRYGFDCS